MLKSQTVYSDACRQFKSKITQDKDGRFNREPVSGRREQILTSTRMWSHDSDFP